MRIRRLRFLEIVVCYRGRRCDGRSWSLQVSKAVLPRYRSWFSKHQFTQPQLLAVLCLMRYEDWTFRQAEVRLGEHRELRQALGSPACPISRRCIDSCGVWTTPPSTGRSGRRCAGCAGLAEKTAGTPAWPWTQRGWRKERSVRSSCGACIIMGKAAAVAALVEMGGRSGFGSAVPAVADRAPGSVERLCEFACGRRSRFAGHAHRTGPGRCRIRQREKSHLNLATARSAKCDPCQTREEGLVSAWHACPVAASLSAPTLAAPGFDRKRILFAQTQALGARTGRRLQTQQRQALLLGLSFNLYRRSIASFS
jgi:hypothetical protein